MAALLDGLNKFGIILGLIVTEGDLAIRLLPLAKCLRPGERQNLKGVLDFSLLKWTPITYGSFNYPESPPPPFLTIKNDISCEN